jgi:ectoine hydroxylase-related dioxygenase (phytanoyl-CoA dioxygenase family)
MTLTDGFWAPLMTRGFVVVTEFLSKQELDVLCEAYRVARRADVARYVALEPDPAAIASVLGRAEVLLPEIRRATQSRTDTLVDQGVFFATEHMNLDWHSDYKSYYLFQDHRHHLSFWVPIIKPDRRRSGLSIVPMDRLRERAEAVFALLQGRGTTRYEDGFFHYEEDGHDRRMRSPVDLEDLEESPELAPGDALVFRSDVLHRTQDTETARVALGLRALWGDHSLRRAVLLSGSPGKRKRLLGEPNAFCECLAAFWLYGRPHMTAGEFLAARRRFADKELGPLLAFAGARLVFRPLLTAEGLRRRARS